MKFELNLKSVDQKLSSEPACSRVLNFQSSQDARVLKMLGLSRSTGPKSRALVLQRTRDPEILRSRDLEVQRTRRPEISRFGDLELRRTRSRENSRSGESEFRTARGPESSSSRSIQTPKLSRSQTLKIQNSRDPELSSPEFPAQALSNNHVLEAQSSFFEKPRIRNSARF